MNKNSLLRFKADAEYSVKSFLQNKIDDIKEQKWYKHLSTINEHKLQVGKNCFIGSQSVLANCITIGDDIIVGAGSFVRKSITEKGIYSGNPAILKIKAK